MKLRKTISSLEGLDPVTAALYDQSDTGYALNLDRYTQKLEDRVDSLGTEFDAFHATSLAKDMARELAITGSADVLVPHIAQRIRIEIRDGQRKPVVVDRDGRLSALSIDDLRAEISKDPVFAPLVSRGGAPNNNQQLGLTRTRTQFDGMTHEECSEFFGRGGQVIDSEPEAESPNRNLPAGTITRRTFDRLSHRERTQHFADGGKLVD